MARAYAPKPGFGWNPLRKLDRNGPCVCDSGKKYKKCCLPKMPDVLPAETIAKLWKKAPPDGQES